MSVKKDLEDVNTKLGLIEAAVQGLTNLFKNKKASDSKEDENEPANEDPDEEPENEEDEPENPEADPEEGDEPEDVRAMGARVDKALAAVEQLTKQFKSAKEGLDAEADKKSKKQAAKTLSNVRQKPFAGASTQDKPGEKYAKLKGRAKLVAAVRDKVITNE